MKKGYQLLANFFVAQAARFRSQNILPSLGKKLPFLLEGLGNFKSSVFEKYVGFPKGSGYLGDMQCLSTQIPLKGHFSLR